MGKPLTRWVVHQSPYCAPEVSAACLSGRLPEGKRVRTSRIVEVIDRLTCKTESGSIYHLDGEPHPDWPEAKASWFDKSSPLEGVAACLRVQAEGKQQNV